MVNPLSFRLTQMKNIITVIVLFQLLSACQSRSNEATLPEIHGEENAVIYANQFLKEIGGRDKWNDLNYIYVKYFKKDDAFLEYYSDEWLSLKNDELIMDQTIQNIRNIRMLAPNEGWINDAGSVSTMDENLYNFLRYYIDQDYFRSVARLARGTDVSVVWTNLNQLVVKDLNTEEFLFAFAFKDEWLPHRFIRRKFNEQDISLNLKSWELEEGLMIPTEGYTDLQNFFFKIETFEPCYKSGIECFDIEFNYDYLSGVE